MRKTERNAKFRILSRKWTSRTYTTGLSNYTANCRRSSRSIRVSEQTLDQLIADIRKLQEQSEGHTPHEYSRLRDRLKESVARLEASHPTVTLVMGQVIDQLAKMGILGVHVCCTAFRRNIGSQDSGITRSALHESWRRSESA